MQKNFCEFEPLTVSHCPKVIWREKEVQLEISTHPSISRRPVLLLTSIKMLRGLYEFRPINDKTLGFHFNDLLLFLEPHARDKNWLRVADDQGHVGFVPINFIQVFKETTSEGLLAFLDESIRRARRDHLPTTELLSSVRQNIVTSPYTTEEHVRQIDREVSYLRAKAISELNYEEPSSGSVVPTATAGVGGALAISSTSIQNKRHSSPRGGGRDLQQSHPLPSSSSSSVRSPGGGRGAGGVAGLKMEQQSQNPNLLGDGSAFVPSPTSAVAGAVGGAGHEARSKKKKDRKAPQPLPPHPHSHPHPHPHPPEPFGDDVVQYSQLQHIGQPLPLQPQPQLPLMGNPDLVAEYVRSTVVPVPGPIPGSHYLTGHGGEGHNHELFPNMTLLRTEEAELYCDHDCGCGKPRPTLGMGRRFSQDELLSGGLLGAELVDIVRNATGLSHKLSQDATEAVLNFVIETFGRNEWSKVRQLLRHLEATPRAVSQELGVIAASPDAKTIRTIFNRLTQCKEDEQQRSWALHEDEAMILDHLEKLNKILNDADPSIPKFVMESGQYRSVSELALYYQMETRWSIRTKLVDCFKAMCFIDEKAHSVLLNSILPMELAREIRDSRDKEERMLLCGDLLAILLSSGEPIPISHFDSLDFPFVEFLLQTVESPPNEDEKITDCIMNLIFAYNLQFTGHKDERDNVIITTLERMPNASVFTQKVIYFLNRGVEPVDLLLGGGVGRNRSLPNSVVKLTTDILSNQRTADLFYTNDIKVLIDIVTRRITDLCPGDETRTAYLILIRVIIKNPSYLEHTHRYKDIKAVFSSIIQEERLCRDQTIVNEITSEYNTLFGIPPF